MHIWAWGAGIGGLPAKDGMETRDGELRPVLVLLGAWSSGCWALAQEWEVRVPPFMRLSQRFARALLLPSHIINNTAIDCIQLSIALNLFEPKPQP